jgi:predicted porin
MTNLHKNRGINGFAAGAAALAAAHMGAAHALEASDVLVFSRGPLSLRPQFSFVEQYNDNIYYSNGGGGAGSVGRQSDFITTLAPGLRVLVGEDLPEANHFTLSYRMEDVIFADHGDQNAIQHRVADDMRYAWTRLTVTGRDRFDWLSSILGAGFGSVPQKVDRFVWGDFYNVRYALGERTGIYGDIAHRSTDYSGSYANLFDSRNITGTVGADYQFTRDTHFFGEMYYGNTTREANVGGLPPLPDTTLIGGFVGARGNFTEKLRGMAKAGYGMSSFGGAKAAGGGLDSVSSPVIEIGLSYQFTERLKTSLNYTRSQQVSVQYSRASYIDDSVSLRAVQIIGATGRLRADAGVNYTLASYDKATAFPKGRSDSYWNFDAGISYSFQTWLSSRLGYAYEIFSSDFNGVVDYDVNRITLSLAVGY